MGGVPRPRVALSPLLLLLTYQVVHVAHIGNIVLCFISAGHCEQRNKVLCTEIKLLENLNND